MPASLAKDVEAVAGDPLDADGAVGEMVVAEVALVGHRVSFPPAICLAAVPVSLHPAGNGGMRGPLDHTRLLTGVL